MVKAKKDIRKIAKEAPVKCRVTGSRVKISSDGLEKLVAEVIAGVREALQSHGGDVELAGVVGQEVRLRFTGACGACMYASGTLAAIAQRLREKTPAGTRIVLVR